MFKRIKNYKIILLKKDNLDMKEYSAPVLFLSFFSLSVIIITTLLISLYATDLSKLLSLYEVRKHRENNLNLEQKIINQKN